MAYNCPLNMQPLAKEYSRHFLTQVIFQADFDIEALRTEIHASLIESCKQETGADLVVQQNTTINFQQNQVTHTVTPQYVFKGSVFQIVVQQNYLQVVNFKYTNHNDYHPVIERIFNKVRSVYNPSFKRIALRYVNNINLADGSTFDFGGLINPVLLQATLDYKDFGLTRSIGIMNIFGQDDIQTTFVYGFVNSQFPNKIAKREFTLDYDCFTMLNAPVDNVKPVILQLRNKVNELFEKSILENLRQKMLQNG